MFTVQQKLAGVLEKSIHTQIYDPKQPASNDLHDKMNEKRIRGDYLCQKQQQKGHCTEVNHKWKQSKSENGGFSLLNLNK